MSIIFPALGKSVNQNLPQHGARQISPAKAMLPVMGNNLKKLRDSKGWTHDQAAAALGVSRGQFIKLERGERRLTSDYINRAAIAFGVRQTDVIGQPETVPIVGIAGAGPDGSIEFTETELGEAPMPPGGNDKSVAVEVRGASMRGVAEDGWLVYYDDRRSPLTDDLIGELCVLWLADGRVVVKTPYAGREANKFDLESTNAPTMRDEAVIHAAAVTAIVPRRSARKLALSKKKPSR